MEDQRARFVSRSPGPAAPGGRSQWHGMDLHTTTPSSHRRAMYIAPPAAASQPASQPAGQPASQPDASRQRAEAAALSARNQVLHRRLSERKRFDSADYAMKMVRQAMETPAGAADGAPALSPSHGRRVFANAMGTDGTEASDDNQTTSAAVEASPRTRAYGALGNSTKSASAAMSARNILIQKKLKEKRHFDSADYQLARQGVSTDATMEDMGEPALDPHALPFARTPSPMTINVEATTSSPVNSPSAAQAAAVRSNQMSPSLRGGRGGAFSARPDPSKYGALATKSSAMDLRRNTLLRQQESFIAAKEATQNPAGPTSPASNQAAASPSTGSSHKYGKLVAANILFRKNLKDRQRFDSADYEMEAASKQARSTEGGLAGFSDVTPRMNIISSGSNQDEEPYSPVMKPQAKHIKLSGDSGIGGWSGHDAVNAPQKEHQQQSLARGGWASHPRVAAAREMQARAQQPSLQARGDVSDGVLLAARSVLLNRKLSEGKKMFDSGEYFAAKDLASRAASNRRHQDLSRENA